MSIRNVQTLFCAVVLLTSCTANRRQPIVQEGPKTGQENQGSNPAIPGDKEQNLPSNGLNNNTTLPIVLDEAALKKAYANIDTSKMSYSFEYLTTKSLGAVVFKDGKAQLEFKDLKAGEKGDLSFTLLEAGVARLRGEQKDVILTKGKNQISLVLKSVGGQDSNATELTINVEVSPSDIASPQPDSGGGGIIKPDPTPKPDPKPDTGGSIIPSDPSALTFSRSIKPIMMKHCAECHHQGGHTPDLTTKAAFETQFDKILGRIEGAGQPMPPLPRDRMKSPEIETLRSWKAQGFKP
jgi:hypothetical protein